MIVSFWSVKIAQELIENFCEMKRYIPITLRAVWILLTLLIAVNGHRDSMTRNYRQANIVRKETERLMKRSTATNLKLDISFENSHRQLYRLILEQSETLLHPLFIGRHSTDLNASLEQTKYFTGFVEGFEGNSFVTITTFGDDDLFEGRMEIIGNDNETGIYHFEVLRNVTGSRVIAYSDSDIESELEHGKCSASQPPTSGSDHTRKKRDFEGLQAIPINYPIPKQNENQRLRKRCTGDMCTVGQCPIALIGDLSFYERYGNASIGYMLSIMNDVQALWFREIGIELPVIYTYIITSGNDESNLGRPNTDALQLLYSLQSAVYGKRFPNYDRVAGSVCLVHLLTAQNFQPTIGIAFTGVSLFFGICTTLGRNVALSTAKLGNYYLSRASVVRTVAHEIGHNFGALHDQEYKFSYGKDDSQCLTSDLYLMSNSLTTGLNSVKFSQCSKEMILNRVQNSLACLQHRNTIDSLITDTQTQPQDKMEFDQCRIEDFSTLPAPKGFWSACPYSFSDNSRCRLLCSESASPGLCYQFQIANGIQFINKTDGTVCDAGSPLPKICLNGVCQEDRRPNVCSRSKQCCSPFGERYPTGRICKIYSEGDNGTASSRSDPCRPKYDYCDQTLGGVDQDDCPINLLPPGAPCYQCANPSNISSCSNQKVCGTSSYYGICIDPNVQHVTNFTTLCKSLKCKSGKQTCAILAGQARCVSITQPSCRYLCGNDVFDYKSLSAAASDGQLKSWGCDCKIDCGQRGSCCSDYDRFCYYNGFSGFNQSNFILDSDMATSASQVLTATKTKLQLTMIAETNITDLGFGSDSVVTDKMYFGNVVAFVAAGIVAVVSVAVIVIFIYRKRRKSLAKEDTCSSSAVA